MKRRSYKRPRKPRRKATSAVQPVPPAPPPVEAPVSKTLDLAGNPLHPALERRLQELEKRIAELERKGALKTGTEIHEILERIKDRPATKPMPIPRDLPRDPWENYPWDNPLKRPKEWTCDVSGVKLPKRIISASPSTSSVSAAFAADSTLKPRPSNE